VHWGWLYATALIAALSHLLLDWTNNYGLRPFFPFNPRWYAGSFMFIAEPVLWAMFLLALVMPWLFGLVAGEIGARRKEFRGRGWAIFALVGMVMLWGWRWSEHGRAQSLVEKHRGCYGSGDAHGDRALSDQSVSLARDSGDCGVLPDCRNQHPDRGQSTAIRSRMCCSSRR
jgi:hypothetical protein